MERAIPIRDVDRGDRRKDGVAMAVKMRKKSERILRRRYALRLRMTTVVVFVMRRIGSVLVAQRRERRVRLEGGLLFLGEHF